MQPNPSARAVAPAPPDALVRLTEGTLGDPFAVLGPHDRDGVRHVTVFQPGSTRVSAWTDDGSHALAPVEGAEFVFSGAVPGAEAYRLEAEADDGNGWSFEDPYRFAPLLADFGVAADGSRLSSVLGAQVGERDGVSGTRFAVWAPNASRVSVVGPFNFWDGRRHPMHRHTASGLWELFLPGVSAGACYKYEILDADGALLPPKADPDGFGAEAPPGNASVVRDLGRPSTPDDRWAEMRAGLMAPDAPVSIYEVHLGSWRRRADGRAISYAEAAEELVAHAAEMGFTHIELLPIAEHPFDGSWGYQPVGLFAPTARHGMPDEFRGLVDAAHGAGLGVILDWVAAHFPTDPHGLGRFDGTALYEYADPREGFHPDWNTLIYDYGKPEVRAFLTANARFWLEEYGADALRVDAVASMLFRDFSRREGEWVPNVHGGRENLEAMDFLRGVNRELRAIPGVTTIAEESDGHPGVTAPSDEGGLGFGYKWNMGWMSDSLSYMAAPPAARPARHHDITFGLTYAFSERFVLAISHDEVVHGKGSMFGKMPGSRADRFANLRAFYGFMWGHPGKKLLFMGQEFGQESEWNHDGSLDWECLSDPAHAGLMRLVADLNALYRATPALHAKDGEGDGFEWIEADDTDRSVYAWVRRGRHGDAPVAVICNFSSQEYRGYRVGLPHAGRWREALNTDAGIYGGLNRGNMGAAEAQDRPARDKPASAELRLPPLSTLILEHQG